MTQITDPRPTPPEFLPKLITSLREGYRPADLRADAAAGLTVAIVALPLSMAIAIASGVGPAQGLYTAIVGGFLVSALGGSRFQIGGPAGAFIVLVSACVAQIGVGGLGLAVLLSGLFLTALAGLRAGTYVRFVPYPVTVGFTAGIAVIIAAAQLKDLLGLTLPGAEPGPVVDKLAALWTARGSVTPAAVAVAAGTVAAIFALKRLAPRAPSLLLAVALAALAAALLQLPVETLHSRFGALPRSLPQPGLPPMTPEALQQALPWALRFTLLGAIESLLSAVVADGMSGRRHRPNAELLAQGVANVGAALFAGIPVTGTIARTATNVRAGARSPVAGMLHALFVLGFMLVAAPLAGYIPLAALAGVLAVVAWNMVERDAIAELVRHSRPDAVVLAATFLIVVFRDLSEGIVVGFALAGIVFIHSMSGAAEVEMDSPPASPEPASPDLASPGPAEAPVVFHLHGPWFFGAAARLGSLLDQMADQPRDFVVDLADVPLIDSSGAHALALLARKLARRGRRMVVAGASPALRRGLETAGLGAPLVAHAPDVAAARLWLAGATNRAT